MDSKEFIKSKIDELVIQFPNIKCHYQFDEFDNDHGIEILPIDFFIIDEMLDAAINKIRGEFMETYPFEGLYFIEDDELTNIIYTKQGSQFK